MGRTSRSNKEGEHIKRAGRTMKELREHDRCDKNESD